MPDPAGSDADVVAARIDAWREAVAQGDHARFAQRLERANVHPDDLPTLLGPVRRPADRPPPGWVATFERALALAPSSAGEHPFRASEEPFPFEELLVPFVLAARGRLAAASSEDEQALLTAEAHAALERALLRRLAGLSARALLLEFSIERASRTTPLERLFARASEAPPRAVYDAFVGGLLGGGLVQLYRRYPVLARLTSRATDLWIEATAELLHRLARDREELERVFGGGESLGRVVAAEPGLSDPHRGGRTVVALTFATGRTLLYKPKDLGTEHAFNRLLSWFDEQGSPLPFRVITVLARPGYGWVERVEPEPCPDADAAARYYRRAGMLLCLVYALGGTDFHRDNLVASGEHPVLVDVEALLHHRPVVQAGRSRARELAYDALVDGVLGTGLLPSWEASAGSDADLARDISGLHTAHRDELVHLAPSWEALNTDGMTLRRAPVTLPTPANQPTLGGRPLRVDDHAAEVLDGFERFYRYLLRRRDALLKPDSPLADLLRQRVRFLFRNTRVYGGLHAQLCDPAYLASAVDRSIQLELLGRAVSGDGGQGWAWWPVVEAEREAMEDLDVPLFTARADGVRLTLGPGRELDGCLREPSADFVVDRVRRLGEYDLEQQLGFVVGSLYATSARHWDPTAGTSRVGPRRSSGGNGHIALELVAAEIAAELAARAIRGSDGGACWIAPQYLPRLERYQLQPIAHDLHSGACGIVLFLAAVERVAGGGYRDLALGALEPLRDALARSPDALADTIGVGGATGLGSVVYALTQAGQMLDEPDLLDVAAAVAALATDERIARAPKDVFDGLAGGILGLLALHSARSDPAMLDRARACGRRLLETRSPGAGGHLAWVTFKGERLLTGFSHGAAGIAFALIRLYAATGDAAYRSAAVEAIAHEDELFDPELRNWADLREDEQPAYKVNWCHGAPGIGLARLGGLDALDTPQVRLDVEAAVETTLLVDVDGPDHLCCGNLGRADTLLVAGRRLGREDLLDAGRARIDEVARRAQATGGFTLHQFLPRRVYVPGFWQGMAGVGYELLRAVEPELLPSVLLWE